MSAAAVKVNVLPPDAGPCETAMEHQSNAVPSRPEGTPWNLSRGCAGCGRARSSELRDSLGPCSECSLFSYLTSTYTESDSLPCKTKLFEIWVVCPSGVTISSCQRICTWNVLINCHLPPECIAAPRYRTVIMQLHITMNILFQSVPLLIYCAQTVNYLLTLDGCVLGCWNSIVLPAAQHTPIHNRCQINEPLCGSWATPFMFYFMASYDHSCWHKAVQRMWWGGRFPEEEKQPGHLL